MAWLELDPSGRYHIAFRFGAQKYKRSLRTKSKAEANQLLHRIDRKLQLLELGDIEVPSGTHPTDFLLGNGNHQSVTHEKLVRTLGRLFSLYLEAISHDDSIESNSRSTIQTHLCHLERHIGARFDPQQVTTETLQSYINKRRKDKGRRGKLLSSTTIRKEMVTFGGVWKWGLSRKLVKNPFPKNGLQYPKDDEKPPFQTIDQIKVKIDRGGLTEIEMEELWDCLFLRTNEVQELLEHVEASAYHPFLHPMIATAAYTGARRSELIRAIVDDIDLQQDIFMVREKKRQRGKLTLRRVPIHPTLRQILREWLDCHPGGRHLFCLPIEMCRSNKSRSIGQALTPDEATDHFKRVLANSRWSKVRGWHVLRHSFASNCAAKGVDQRLINEWMGHQTEAMVKRYRHHFAEKQMSAIETAFD